MEQTITNEELWHGIHLLKIIDKNGNDGADIYDFEQFEQFLLEKYGKPVLEEIFLAYAKTTNKTTNNKQLEKKGYVY